MSRPDPYCSFTDDRERRRALNARVRSHAMAIVASALITTPINWKETLQWLMTLFH